MRRRDKAEETQRRKTSKRRNTAKVAGRPKFSAVDAAKRIAFLEHCLKEALTQQTATADVLKVIKRSTFDLKLVLEALIESATRLSGAIRGHILQFDGEFLVFAAAHGAFPGFTGYLEAHPFRPGQGTIAGRAAAERRTVHVRDVLDEPATSSAH
jgi:hypothetical protein